ncbi:unnamed protein product [Staurois parvus]|uniref:Uncharacterized protein n=1 Tax=Staurois parvus TaxID=386267 RepID=A0ABN9CED5_9NEOB|nr:unnamed protein product [Staurois parvus]
MQNRFYQCFKRKMRLNTANRVYKRLHFTFCFTLPVPSAVQSLFFIMKNACKEFSRCSDGQNTEHRMFLPSLSHIVMTKRYQTPSHPWKQKKC